MTELLVNRLPITIVCVIAVILSLLFYRRATWSSILALTGAFILTVLNGYMLVFGDQVFGYIRSAPNQEIRQSRYLMAAHIEDFFRIIGLSTLIAAAFCGRYSSQCKTDMTREEQK